jgi:predicted ATPase
VGRDEELRHLSNAWAAVEPGVPQAVMVDGPAGVGKSALLSAFVAEHASVRAITWTGDETETDLRFAMAEEVLGAPGQWADPYAAGIALLRSLGELTAAGPLLLALDDLHLADQASLVALNFAVRRLQRDPALLLFSARADRLDRLPASLVRSATEAGHRITLAGLAIPAIQDLAEQVGSGQLSRRAAERLRSLTDGNPLHLQALLKEVPAHDLERLDRPLPAPASFAQLVLADLATTSTEARQVAMAAAVLGERAEIADLATVAGLDATTILRPLEELARIGMLRVPAGHTSAQFVHPLFRAAVYADVGPAARRDLHLRAADLFTVPLALHHRLAATMTTDETLAVDLEDWATRQRTVGDLAGAAEALIAAHRVTPPGPVADGRLLAGVELLAIGGDAKAAQRHEMSIGSLPATG